MSHRHHHLEAKYGGVACVFGAFNYFEIVREQRSRRVCGGDS